MQTEKAAGSEPVRVVVVGGGFGGVATVRALSKQKNLEITLVSDTTSFRYYPALYRLAVGFSKQQGIIPLKSLLQKMPNVTFVHASLEGIDRNQRTLSLSKNRTLPYDYAVLALGVTTSYFGINGLEEYSYSIKTAEKLKAFHSHLHDEIIKNHELDQNYIVVGGGPTGIELSASLAGYLRQVAKRHRLKEHKIKLELVEAAPRLLPSMPEKASKLASKRLRKLGVTIMTGAKVEGETDTSLQVNGRSIPTHTVVWTAGVTNSPFYKAHPESFQFSKRGKVVVNEQLQVDDHVYVIGDNAETPFSGLAEVAVMQARYISKDIMRRLNGQSRPPYHNKRPTSVVPVGSNWAILQRGNFIFGGRIAGLIRKAADVIGYRDVMGLRKALKILRYSELEEESCPICRASMDHHKKPAHAVLET